MFDHESLQMQLIEFKLNGKLTRVEVEPASLLSEVLREKLGLTGTKVACDEGTCGSCTVLLESKPVYSCMVLAVDCGNKSVETLEGLSSEGESQNLLQDAFVQVNSSQCGFCTPGMVMSAKAILDKNPEPSREEVKLALSGNICRCTDYSRYVEAVLVAAREMRNKVEKEDSVHNA